MKAMHHILGIAASITLILVIFITSFEAACYSDYGWYEKEYEKYGVLEDLEMEMSDVMTVTEEMMEYLRGDRENLVVYTVVAGEEQEFFNEKEKMHMEDVLRMFQFGLSVRKICMVLTVLLIAVILLTKGELKSLLPKSFLIGAGTLTAVTGVAVAVFMTDFNKYFIMFHHIFFTNDLWLLDPDTDLMIRMLPEGFFLDMVVRIGLYFLTAMGILLVISAFMLLVNKKKNNRVRSEN